MTDRNSSPDVIRWDGIEPDDFEVSVEGEVVTVAQAMPGECWLRLENGEEFRIEATAEGKLTYQQRGA